MADICKWPLGNGYTLDFAIYASNGNWNPVPGLYIFAYPATGGWFPLYVGQADDLSTRLPNHERLTEAVQRGATHIHALVVNDQGTRLTWEKMLIKNLQPPMNDQLL